VALLDLANLAGELLDHAAEILDAAANPGLGVPGAPERQVLAVSAPVFDFGACDQLAVSTSPAVRKVTTGDQLETAVGTACHGMTMAGLRVWLTGCLPSVKSTGAAPPAADLNASATRLYAQGWALWCGLVNRDHAGTLFPVTLAGYLKPAIVIAALTPIAASGGTQGWTIDVAVQLDPDPAL
jgi:hypothetical protein